MGHGDQARILPCTTPAGLKKKNVKAHGVFVVCVETDAVCSRVVVMEYPRPGLFRYRWSADQYVDTSSLHNPPVLCVEHAQHSVCG